MKQVKLSPMTQPRKGFILPVLLFTALFITLITMYVASLSLTTYNLSTREVYKVNAQMAADAGLDQAMTLLNTQGTSGFAGSELAETTLLNSGNIKSTYQKSLLDGSDDNHKTVSVVSRVYSPPTAATPKIIRRYEMDVQAVTSGNGPASVVSGIGGLLLNGNAKISGGDVVVNGSITVNNNAQIGLSTNPVNVRAAQQNCPTTYDNTYPRVCAAGENGQPITANGPIYGDVKAQNQTNGANMFNPGLTSSVASPIVVPGYNRTAQKASLQNPAGVVGNPNAAGYNPSSAPIKCSGGTANWPANVKITGDVSLTNNCTITINGNVWITGNLSFGNGSKIQIPNSLGSTRPVIMVDGSTGVFFGNNSAVLPNNVGTGGEFITTWWNTNTATNGNFTCGGIADPLDCTNVTGVALKTSQGTMTINYNNNATASGSVLRALWSRVFIANNGQLGAVSGQTVELGNNAVINFTSSIPGSANIIITWAKRGYMRVYQ